MADNPQFAVPFILTNDGSLEVEQDSDEELQFCAWAVLAYEPGMRIDIPEFGTPEQAFSMGGVNTDRLIATILQYEPRAVEVIETDPNWTETLQQIITVRRDNRG